MPKSYILVRGKWGEGHYDAAGNLILNAACGSGTPTYSYDAENNLTSTAGVTYAYDGDGRRTWKSVPRTVCYCPPPHGGPAFAALPGGCNSPCSSVTFQSPYKVYWYGATGNALDETDGSGSTNNASFREFVFFNGQRIARRDNANNVSYFFSDHLGSARVITDPTGAVVERSDLYPFGVERVPTSNTYKFTGYERDSESGLDNASARYYNSLLGRFMTPDPMPGSVGNPQSWNRYAYVYNNPINATDPAGLCSEDDGWFCGDAFLSFTSLDPGGAITGAGSYLGWGGFVLSDGSYFLTGDMFPVGFTTSGLLPFGPQAGVWPALTLDNLLNTQTFTFSGNLYHTPSVSDRGMGDWAAALPVAARIAEPGVNYAGTVLSWFSTVALATPMDAVPATTLPSAFTRYTGTPFAMGLDAFNLQGFAAARGASTAMGEANMETFVMRKLADPETAIHFNLDGVDVWKGVSRASTGLPGKFGATDWELLQIKQNPQFWNRITFWKNGQIVPNPFQ